MHKAISLAAVAVTLSVVGCVGQRSQIRSVPNRPEAIVLTNSLPEFRQYDEAFANCVQERWYDLLDARSWNHPRSGKVVVDFTLHNDGLVTDMVVLENSTNDILALLCEKAILDLQPFPVWPEMMREMVKGDHRRITFSFHFR